MDLNGAGRDLSIEELHEVVAPIAVEHGVLRIYLFGSRARGDNDKNSDYDFCIDVPKEYDLFDLGGILYDLQEALCIKVDLVCEDEIYTKPSLMEEILRDRKILFEA
ncbi:MAG: nucleotidyltransferase domain-containing protein [Candidatus Methanoplasma sp.]|nr:nucleotidyltransferase domain-containing protein [Candidatus Methanoplasma sp.]